MRIADLNPSRRRACLSVAVVVLALCAPAMGADDAAALREIREQWAEEAKADFEVAYSNEGKLHIGIGAVRDGVQHVISFSFEELAPFWERQRHKDFILIVLAKGNRTEDERKALAKRLNDYFFKAGFRRVRVRQGLGGMGYELVSDTINPSPAGQATPR